MKKVIFTVICLLLTLSVVSCNAAISYTLPEKMNKQLAIGSGLSGTFTVAVNGDTSDIEKFVPFLNKTYKIKGIISGDQFDFYAYQDSDEGIAQTNTELYGTNGNYYLISDLADGKVFRLMTIDEIIDRFTTNEGGNPSLWSAVRRYIAISDLIKKEQWNPMFTHYEGLVEKWLSGYSSGTAIKKTDSGTTLMEMTYIIPFNALTDGISDLMKELLNDEDTVNILGTILDEDQKNIYLNRYLNDYYMDALKIIDGEENIVLSRTVSTLGETVSGHIELPLVKNKSGFSCLIIDKDEKYSSFSLSNETERLDLICQDAESIEDGNEYNFWFCRYPVSEEGNNVKRSAVHIKAVRSSSVSKDEDGIEHQNDRIIISTESDTSRLPDTEKGKDYPVSDNYQMELSLHYFSKQAQSSPTMLDIVALYSSDKLSVEMRGECKTCSPWEITPFETDVFIDCQELTDDELIGYYEELLSGAKQNIK